MIKKSSYCNDWTERRLIIEALLTDGAHHKQWFLEQLLFKLGLDPNKIKEEENNQGYDWEEGVAP